MRRRETGGSVGIQANHVRLACTILVAIMASASWVEASEKNQAETNLELWVEFVDMTGLGTSTLSLLLEEVESIYESAGANIRWLEAAPEGEPLHFARVYLMGELPPAFARRLQAFGRGNPMAMALGQSGSISGPTIYISRSAVVRKATGGAVAEPEPEVLARALGRVMAHELAHRFLSWDHTRRGILRLDFSQSDLMGAGISALSLTQKQIERIQSVATPAAVPPVSSSLVAKNEQ